MGRLLLLLLVEAVLGIVGMSLMSAAEEDSCMLASASGQGKGSCALAAVATRLAVAVVVVVVVVEDLVVDRGYSSDSGQTREWQELGIGRRNGDADVAMVMLKPHCQSMDARETGHWTEVLKAPTDCFPNNYLPPAIRRLLGDDWAEER